MLRRLVFALACLTMAAGAHAQSNPMLTEAERGVRRDEAGPATHVRIDALQLRAHLIGRIAEVSIELDIAADGREPYEAELALTLPADAVVTGYALDVGGRMIPGQLVEAGKARNVYEDEVRAGIDPGLAEVRGNRFTTRIFPISAAQPRRFRLSFATSFDPALGLSLPLARDTAIARVSVSAMAEGYASAPAIRFAGQPLALSRQGDRWHGAAALGPLLLREGLTVTGGTLANPLQIARHASGEAFFVIGDQAGPATAPPPGGRLRIYWDRSRSHRDDRIDLEAELLARLAEQTAPAGIDLVTFASDGPQHLALADAAALRLALGAIRYRGATSLAGLQALALPAAARCVIVSDGVVTIDRTARFAPDCRLMALTSAAGADGARLDRLTQPSGGAVIRLAPGGEAQALAALATAASGPVAIRDATGTPLAVRRLPAAPGAWLLIGPMPTTDIVVTLAGGGVRRYAADTPPLQGDAPGALWAAAHVAALADDPARHDAMVAAARRYGVAGPGLSFLVLETPEQYLSAGIAPPPGFKRDWLAEYRRLKAVQNKAQARAAASRLGFVIRQWQQRRAWWQRTFIAKAPGPRKVPARNNRAEPLASAPGAAPPPPPPPPPPAAMTAVDAMAPGSAAATDEEGNNGDIIVTGATRNEAVGRTARTAPPATVHVELAELKSDRDYLVALDAAAVADRLAVLEAQERRYGHLPGFYLDSAEWFRRKGDAPTAGLLLLSALELPTSDDETRQIIAFRLERDGSFDRAVELAEQLAAGNAVFRPQPGRALALALAARGLVAGPRGRADLERAFKLLVDTALNPAAEDFDGIEVIALMEANALIPALSATGGDWTLDPRLRGLTDTDVRIVIEWTADDADIDLWVDEPNGERVIYSEPLSSAGGQISNDMTDGYGPEEYAIRRAPPGRYSVRVNGYDADRINPNGAGHVLIRLQRNFARRSATQEMVDLDLRFQTGADRNEEDEASPVATLQVEPSAPPARPQRQGRATRAKR